MYRGRLASQGETQGGAHWHYIPNDPSQLMLNPDGVTDVTPPSGYVGVAGMDAANGIVRVQMNIVLNFYTTDPSYSMKIQPPFGHFSSLLYVLRSQVPLVSSNDSHVQKALRWAKNASKSALKFGADNQEDLVKLASLLAKLAALV